LKIREKGERIKKIIRPLNKTTNENPKCHLHIPQPRKGIYVLNIIIQNLLEKKRSERKGPQRNTQNPNAPSRDIENLMEGRTLKETK
jgi:hypothetical protein